MTQLELRALTKTYSGQAVVADVTLSVNAGEIVCLLGPSGCGKTTLLRLVAGLTPPDSGEVWFEGRNLADAPPYQRQFGLMFQEFALFPHRNVYENVAFGLQMRGDSRQQVAQRVAEMLALVDLGGYDSRQIDQLSGGEQQRVALARALAPSPRLLMLDEPLGSLDRALRERLMRQLRDILKRVGVTALYVTHDQIEALAVADRVAIVQRGRLVQIGAPEEIFRQPATPFVAQFLGLENLLPGRTTAQPGEIETALGIIRLPGQLPPPETPVALLIRPDALDAAGAIVWRGRVQAVSFRGRYYQVWLQVGSQALMFEVAGKGSWEEGVEVEVRVSAEKILCLPPTLPTPPPAVLPG